MTMAAAHQMHSSALGMLWVLCVVMLLQLYIMFCCESEIPKPLLDFFGILSF